MSAGGLVEGGGLVLVAVESVSSGQFRLWGPFGDVDEVIGWCEGHGVVVRVAVVEPPGLFGVR